MSEHVKVHHIPHRLLADTVKTSDNPLVIFIDDVCPHPLRPNIIPPAWLLADRRLLMLAFDDLEDDHDPMAMSEKDAITIATWLDRRLEELDGDVDIIVTCYGGVSRSVGVALAIDAHLNGDDHAIAWLQDDATVCPNVFAFNLMADALWDMRDHNNTRWDDTFDQHFDAWADHILEETRS